MDDIKGRKLLILGGNALISDIVIKARDLGVYTIVTDWNSVEDSPAKKIADEHWEISLMDYDILTNQIKKHSVDGIITGFVDSYLIPYQHLCESCGLPCYATKDQFEWSLDKSLFKKVCQDYHVPIVPEYDVKNLDKTIISKENKVIIKPVDNSGSRGICICDDPSQFDELLEFSLGFSPKKKVVIERYMDCDDVSFEYKIQNGEVSLTSICDRYIYKTSQFGSVTSGLIYPSKYLQIYQENVDENVKQMFREKGLLNGVLFMQAFVESNKFYFYEMGFRLSGGRHYIFTKNQNDDSSIEQLIHFAITGQMDNRRISQIATPYFDDVCCQVSVLCKTDCIHSIDGQDELNNIPEIIDTLYSYEVGDTIGKQGTAAQIFARFHIVSHTMEKLKEILDIIKSTLVVKNKQGENIIIDTAFIY